MENLDWKNLGFGYRKTDYNVRCYFRDGKWGELEVSSSEYIILHIGATALHYGQEAFEGLKAFMGRDGKVRIFRLDENALRLQRSCEGILMQQFPVEKFEEAVKMAVRMNKAYIPPYETGASLYIRPLLIGTGAEIGVKPASEYLFIVFVMPVGPYFPQGFQPTDLIILRQYDRAAPQGTGKYKVGGNYAASMVAGYKAKKGGYSAVLYLDSREKKYIDECGPANFFGIKDNTYVTPESDSILPSITNKSLMTLAEEIGMKVERRKVPYEELSTFEEIGACGTAAVISPIKRIYDADENREFLYGKEPGPWSTRLYNKLRAIQYGDESDRYGWTTVVEL
ncbi:MAG: branched-chain amino acid aminotransferase [Prolixibacteraceae bacterium]|jgi:branched-chain amino acid aminotransferase|nr:branched-chain amino acid aminotransferase [Bacteroidota bacterium]OQB81815.1 MAG: Branched-chain-amino-acid aminotransferase [Bacteroidetes bacterium ADurb.Bin123]HNZ67822.1 branched-chain amino acid aminotransferase [Prolixibacteraceae bacterium]HOG94798.1 branched-chain amino acid aminotransferase [Prolixibacteraceae bacterium]HPN76079.1 branched-chain amino acid aminotransferase [Prolixibacteraceae bacterium]